MEERLTIIKYIPDKKVTLIKNRKYTGPSGTKLF